MNARQRKKAIGGKSPRLVEKILGLQRGSCLDCVSFDSPGKVRSYHGTRFTPTASPLSAPHEPVSVDMEHGAFQGAAAYLDCPDGHTISLNAPLPTRPVEVRAEYERSKPWIGLDGHQHRAERWRDEHGERQARLDGKFIPPDLWDWYTKHGEGTP